jgi:hypothetical protein
MTPPKRSATPCAPCDGCPPPRPELAYGGWIFNARPELRAETPGVYLGADALAAIATVEQLLGGGQRTARAPASTE